MFSLDKGLTYTKTITMETEICCNCGIAFGIPSDFRSQCLNDPDKWFHCPNGHRQHYSESREVKLRKEAERALAAKQAELDFARRARENAENEQKRAEKKLKRLNNGVCSCCNLSFTNLAEHIKTKHPELINKEKPKRGRPKKQELL